MAKVKLIALIGTAITILALGGYCYYLRNENAWLELDRDTYKAANEALIKSAQAVNAELTKVRLDETQRANQLITNIKNVESSNEKMQCPLPTYMWDAINSM